MSENLPFYRKLPDGRMISSVSFGCSSIWAKPSFDCHLARQIVEAAVEGGINYFDSGPSYGAGEGERRLGQFLARRSLDDLLISTKVGTYVNGQGRAWRSFRLADMEKSFDESLLRLGVERVDILYLHGPKISDLNEEVLNFLEKQKRRGRVVWSGVNSFNVEVLSHCAQLPIDAVMLQYNVVDQTASEVMELLHGKGKIIISGTAMARAIYSPRVFLPTSWERVWYLLRALKSDPMFLVKGAQLRKRLRLVGDDGARAAIRYVVGNPFVHSATFGTSRIENMIANIEAGRRPMSAAHRKIVG
jgi:D-threo-aldose 1-dehydrogenase